MKAQKVRRSPCIQESIETIPSTSVRPHSRACDFDLDPAPLPAPRLCTERYPGAIWNFSQPIEDNVGETLTGTKGQRALKVFGSDLKLLEGKGEEVSTVMKGVTGLTDVKLLRDFGQPNLNLTVDSRKAARFGINVADIQDAIQTAVGGNSVSQVLIGEQRYDVVVLYQAPYRNTAQAIEKILALRHNHTLQAARTNIQQNQAAEITENLRPNPTLFTDWE